MKIKLKKENTPMYIALLILGICIIFMIGFAVYAAVTYFSGHEITVTDKTDNINVMLTRPENWKKIETGKITLTKKDLALIDGSTATIPITAELARQFCDAPDEKIGDYVDHRGTHRAYENLICTNGDPEKVSYDTSYGRQYASYEHHGSFEEKKLIFAVEPSEDELESAEKENVSFDITPIALDGFVFITHKDNPIDSLTVEQVRQIYSGKITNWKDVGGNDEKIIPYQRNSDSGSQTAMRQLVMTDPAYPLMEPAEGYSVWEMWGLVEKIAEYDNRENSIGYTYYYYLNNLYRNDNIKVLKINGVSPDNENLINGEYPFSTAYYVVIADGKNDPDTAKFKELRDYLLTDEGQEIIQMAGYCPAVGREE